VILTKDVIKDEELLDCGWESGEGAGKKQATLCRCNSKQCRMFLEKDHCKILEKLLKGFKRLNQTQFELKDFQFSLEPNQGFTANIIVEKIKSLGILGNAARIGDAMESLLIYQYFESHDLYCDAPKKKNGRGAQNGCSHCNLKLYKAYYTHTGSEIPSTITDWILKRKKRGHFLSLIHSKIHLCLEFYYDEWLSSFTES
jgi:hypothetical protein